MVTGPVRTGRVLTRLTAAAVITLDGGPDDVLAPDVLALLAPGAAATPHGLRLLHADAGAVLTAASPGRPVTVGGGAVVLAGLRLCVGRAVPSRIPASGVTPGALARLDRISADRPGGLGTDPRPPLQAVLAADGPGPMVQLLGRGPGLTPSGDDLIAGVLAGLWASGCTAAARRIGAEASRLAPGRTTVLSADLLRWAARGHAGTELLAVIAAAGRHPVDRARIDRAAQALLAVGHTSGSDLLAGLVAGLSGSQEFRTGQGGPIRLATRHGKDPP